MKTTSNSSWLARLINVFRSTPPETDAPPKKSESKEAPRERPQKIANKSVTAQDKQREKRLPSDKARESNLDRYKHPSDFMSSNY